MNFWCKNCRVLWVQLSSSNWRPLLKLWAVVGFCKDYQFLFLKYEWCAYVSILNFLKKKELSTVLQIYTFLYHLSKFNWKSLGFGKNCLDLGHCTSIYIIHVFSLGVVMVVVLYVSAEYCGRSQNKEPFWRTRQFVSTT